MTKEGYVCVLINKQGQVRISLTTKEPKARAKQISSNKGKKFWVEHSVYVSDCQAVKTMVHRVLADRRWGKTDMFMVDEGEAIRTVDLCAIYYEEEKGEEEEEEEEQLEDNSSEEDTSINYGLILILLALALVFLGKLMESVPP